MRVLLIKMSSLGDVVHALPAVTDAAAHGVTFDWVVEEAFQSIPQRHPAVRRTLPIAWRRWRTGLLRSRHALADFARTLRAEHYDLILDAQGLWKSAGVAAAARGTERCGFAWKSAREAPASLFYGRTVEVARDQHAIDRLRQLFAAACGYRLQSSVRPSSDSCNESAAPPGGLAFGLEMPTATQAERTCVLCHGTTWPSKHWPEPMWRALAESLQELGYRVLLPWGNATEHERAQRIASFPGSHATVLGALSIAELTELMGGAALAVGVDSGLTHLAGALAVPTVVVYGSTDASLTGCRGRQVRNLQADFPCSPCRSKQCSYSGAPVRWQDKPVTPACYASVAVESVLRAVREI